MARYLLLLLLRDVLVAPSLSLSPPPLFILGDIIRIFLALYSAYIYCSCVASTVFIVITGRWPSAETYYNGMVQICRELWNG